MRITDRRSAPKDADADLAAPFGDDVAEDAVGADRRQEQRQAPERHQQHGQEPRPLQRVREHLLHRPHPDDRQRRVHLADGSPQLRRQRVVRQRRADHQVHVRGTGPVNARALFREKEQLGSGRDVHAPLLEILHDADDAGVRNGCA